jgi:hypothetical protein
MAVEDDPLLFWNDGAAWTTILEFIETAKGASALASTTAHISG